MVRIAAAQAVASGHPLVLFHTIDEALGSNLRPDPLAWKLHRKQVLRALEGIRLALPQASGASPATVAIELADGAWLDTLADCQGAAGSLVVIGVQHRGKFAGAIDQRARALAEHYPGSILFVPADAAPREGRTRRIVVPVDGSRFAEAALAEATRIALHDGAAIHLVHVIPHSGMAEFGPIASKDVDLRLQLDRRNEDAACAFLETVRRRLAGLGIEAQTKCYKGDPRTRLLQALESERPDLVILSARGQSGRRCGDLSLGGTASYLVDHYHGPVMLVRSGLGQAHTRLPPAPIDRNQYRVQAA